MGVYLNLYSVENKITMVIFWIIVFFIIVGFGIFHYMRVRTSREEKKQAAEIFNGIFNQVTDCIIILDEAGIIYQANKTFLNYQEKSGDKIVGKSIQRIPTDYTFDNDHTALKEELAEHGVYETNIKFYHSNGEIIPFHVTVKPIKIEKKNKKEKLFLVVTAVDLKISREKDEYINQQGDKLLEIQHLAHLGYWEMNYLTKKIYWSRELYSILGYQEGEVEPNLDIIYWMAYEDDQNRVWKSFLRAFQAQEKVDTHYRIKNNRGEMRDIYLRIRHFFTDNNEHLRTIGIIQDVTKQTDLREELNAQLIFADTVLNNCSLLYVECNSNFEVKSINPMVSQLVGINSEAACGRPLMDIFGKLNRTHRKFVMENMDFRKPLPFKDYTGVIHYIQWDHAIYTKRTGENTNILLGIDISRTIEKRKALETSFIFDPVTKLPNRYKLEQVLTNYFNKNGKNQEKKLALIFIYVDGIHAVGDAFGQHIEDLLIQSLSERLYDAIGKYGLFVRRYVDQFVLFYPQDPNTERLTKICDFISELIEMPFMIEGITFTVKHHLGISKFPDNATTKEDLIRFGSAAMHEAQRLNIDYYFYQESLEKELKNKVIGYELNNN